MEALTTVATVLFVATTLPFTVVCIWLSSLLSDADEAEKASRYRS